MAKGLRRSPNQQDGQAGSALLPDHDTSVAPDGSLLDMQDSAGNSFVQDQLQATSGEGPGVPAWGPLEDTMGADWLDASPEGELAFGTEGDGGIAAGAPPGAGDPAAAAPPSGGAPPAGAVPPAGAASPDGKPAGPSAGHAPPAPDQGHGASDAQAGEQDPSAPAGDVAPADGPDGQPAAQPAARARTGPAPAGDGSAAPRATDRSGDTEARPRARHHHGHRRHGSHGGHSPHLSVEPAADNELVDRVRKQVEGVDPKAERAQVKTELQTLSTEIAGLVATAEQSATTASAALQPDADAAAGKVDDAITQAQSQVKTLFEGPTGRVATASAAPLLALRQESEVASARVEDAKAWALGSQLTSLDTVVSDLAALRKHTRAELGTAVGGARSRLSRLGAKRKVEASSRASHLGGKYEKKAKEETDDKKKKVYAAKAKKARTLGHQAASRIEAVVAAGRAQLDALEKRLDGVVAQLIDPHVSAVKAKRAQAGDATTTQATAMGTRITSAAEKARKSIEAAQTTADQDLAAKQTAATTTLEGLSTTGKQEVDDARTAAADEMTGAAGALQKALDDEIAKVQAALAGLDHTPLAEVKEALDLVRSGMSGAETTFTTGLQTTADGLTTALSDHETDFAGRVTAAVDKSGTAADQVATTFETAVKTEHDAATKVFTTVPDEFQAALVAQLTPVIVAGNTELAQAKTAATRTRSQLDRQLSTGNSTLEGKLGHLVSQISEKQLTLASVGAIVAIYTAPSPPGAQGAAPKAAVDPTRLTARATLLLMDGVSPGGALAAVDGLDKASADALGDIIEAATGRDVVEVLGDTLQGDQLEQACAAAIGDKAGAALTIVGAIAERGVFDPRTDPQRILAAVKHLSPEEAQSFFRAVDDDPKLVKVMQTFQMVTQGAPPRGGAGGTSEAAEEVDAQTALAAPSDGGTAPLPAAPGDAPPDVKAAKSFWAYDRGAKMAAGERSASAGIGRSVPLDDSHDHPVGFEHGASDEGDGIPDKFKLPMSRGYPRLVPVSEKNRVAELSDDRSRRIDDREHAALAKSPVLGRVVERRQRELLGERVRGAAQKKHQIEGPRPALKNRTGFDAERKEPRGYTPDQMRTDLEYSAAEHERLRKKSASATKKNVLYYDFEFANAGRAADKRDAEDHEAEAAASKARNALYTPNIPQERPPETDGFDGANEKDLRAVVRGDAFGKGRDRGLRKIRNRAGNLIAKATSHFGLSRYGLSFNTKSEKGSLTVGQTSVSGNYKFDNGNSVNMGYDASTGTTSGRTDVAIGGLMRLRGGVSKTKKVNDPIAEYGPEGHDKRYRVSATTGRADDEGGAIDGLPVGFGQGRSSSTSVETDRVFKSPEEAAEHAERMKNDARYRHGVEHAHENPLDDEAFPAGSKVTLTNTSGKSESKSIGALGADESDTSARTITVEKASDGTLEVVMTQALLHGDSGGLTMAAGSVGKGWKKQESHVAEYHIDPKDPVQLMNYYMLINSKTAAALPDDANPDADPLALPKVGIKPKLTGEIASKSSGYNGSAAGVFKSGDSAIEATAKWTDDKGNTTTVESGERDFNASAGASVGFASWKWGEHDEKHKLSTIEQPDGSTRNVVESTIKADDDKALDASLREQSGLKKDSADYHGVAGSEDKGGEITIQRAVADETLIAFADKMKHAEKARGFGKLAKRAGDRTALIEALRHARTKKEKLAAVRAYVAAQGRSAISEIENETGHEADNYVSSKTDLDLFGVAQQARFDATLERWRRELVQGTGDRKQILAKLRRFKTKHYGILARLKAGKAGVPRALLEEQINRVRATMNKAAALEKLAGRQKIDLTDKTDEEVVAATEAQEEAMGPEQAEAARHIREMMAAKKAAKAARSAMRAEYFQHTRAGAFSARNYSPSSYEHIDETRDTARLLYQAGQTAENAAIEAAGEGKHLIVTAHACSAVGSYNGAREKFEEARNGLQFVHKLLAAGNPQLFEDTYHQRTFHDDDD